VGDRHRQRVGGIGAGNRGAGQKALDHGVDLRLLGRAVADHGLLDQARGIFADVQPGAGRDHQHHAAGLAELEGRLGVLVDEHFLDRGCLGLVIGQKRFQLRGEVRKAFGQRLGRVGFELAIGEVRKAITIGADDAPAGRSKARVEAEDQRQASFSSSSSGTS